MRIEQSEVYGKLLRVFDKMWDRNGFLTFWRV